MKIIANLPPCPFCKEIPSLIAGPSVDPSIGHPFFCNIDCDKCEAGVHCYGENTVDAYTKCLRIWGGATVSKNGKQTQYDHPVGTN